MAEPIKGPDIYIGGTPKKQQSFHPQKHHGFTTQLADKINAQQMKKFQQKASGTITPMRGANRI